MSIYVMNYIWSLDLPPTVKLVAIALADHAHDDGSEARPSQALLMKKTGLSRVSVQRSLIYLKKAQIIVLERSSSQHRANVFRFILPSDFKSGRSITENPQSRNQTYQIVSQRHQRDSSEMSERRPNPKEQSFESMQIQDQSVRDEEIRLYGHVLSNAERSRLLRATLRKGIFTPDSKQDSIQ